MTDSTRWTREHIEAWPCQVLNNPTGIDRQARVAIYDLPEGKVILKEWHPRSRILRAWSRVCLRREARNYRRLQGIRGIPRLLAELEDGSLVIEFVEAQQFRLDLPRELLLAGLDSFEGLLRELHARRFAHLDARSRGNVLLDRSGKAWLIDFIQGVDCSRGTFRRLIFPILRGIDRSAVAKFRAKFAPETLPPASRDRLVAKYSKRHRNWSPIIGRRILGLLAKDRPEDAEAPADAARGDHPTGLGGAPGTIAPAAAHGASRATDPAPPTGAPRT